VNAIMDRPKPTSAPPGSFPRASEFRRERSRSRSQEEARQRLARHEGAKRSLQPAWMSRGIGVNKEILGETRGDLVKPGLTQADLDQLESKVKQRSNSPDPLGDFFESRPDSKGEQRRNPDPLADFFDSRPEAKEPDPLADFFDSRQQRSSNLDAQFSGPRHESPEQINQWQREFYRDAPMPSGQRAYESWHDSREPGYQRAHDANEYGRQYGDSRGSGYQGARDANEYGWQGGGHDARKPSGRHVQESWHDSRELSHQGGQSGWQGHQEPVSSGDVLVLIDLARHALREGGFIQGHRLGELMNKHHRELVTQAKARFGTKGWIATMMEESTTDIKVTHLPEHGGPCFYLDARGHGLVPTYQAPAIIEGDRIPTKGNAKKIRDQRDQKEDRRRVLSPEPDRRRVQTPSPERFTQPASGRSASSGERSGKAEPKPSKSVWDLL